MKIRKKRLRSEARSKELVRSAMGWFLAYPWFDRVSLWTLKYYFFPLSCMWAAALQSQGAPERFLKEVPLIGARMNFDRLQAVLIGVESAQVTARAVEKIWEVAFFEDSTVTEEELVAIESARLDSRDRLNRNRRQFRFLLRNKVPIQRPNPPSPAEVDAQYGEFLSDRNKLFSAPEEMPVVELSQKVAGAVGTDYWLRFKTPSLRLDDVVYARVHEPEGVENPPTLIFGHGICVDFDHWHGLIDEVDLLTKMGFRVIRPEAPFHGRRCPKGLYSGEGIVSTTPFGPLDSFTSSISEWFVLLDWASKNSTGPLTIGGSSLGALTSLLCADVSKYWPKRIQPQAMLLITHCGRMADALLNGDLAKVWKSRQDTIAAGWNAAETARYFSMLDPDWNQLPAMKPENIISVLGRYDNVTPYRSGMQLLDAWQVPQKNRFLWRRGHFSVPMTMIRNTKPIEAFKQVVDNLSVE